ncbi:MAG TPA: zinc ABC transporter substrate-binding protein [Treponemataceae bacterium]|nr:zinc ABC transporter substrate-binding protein [Treponemataceae bacterium]
MKNITHRKFLFLMVLGLFTVLLCASCNKKIQESSKQKNIVAVSIVPEASFVKKICGADFDVITLIPPGYNPSSYELGPQEKRHLSKAKICFTIGVPAEERILKSLSPAIKRVSLDHIVAKEYPQRFINEHMSLNEKANAKGLRDPHIWLSPKRVQVMVSAIAENLINLNPSNAKKYKDNADAYISELQKLERDIVHILSPVKNKSFIVFHPSFGYFADDFGLHMYALENEGHDASPQTLIKLIDFAKKNGIKTIFYQDEIHSVQSRAFAEEIGGIAVPLYPLAADYSENLRKMAHLIKDSQ